MHISLKAAKQEGGGVSSVGAHSCCTLRTLYVIDIDVLQCCGSAVGSRVDRHTATRQ